MKRKFLSILLTLALALSMLPTAALADLKADSPTAAAAVRLTDVNGHWAENAIRRWVENGVVQGNDGQFDPNGPLTCAQLATILANLLRLGAAGSAGFTDVKAGAWYEDAIDRCAAAGILMGNGDGTVDPDGAISRERAMVMLGRALGIRPAADPDLSKHSDEAQVSSYARGMVAALVAAGIVNGVDGDRLAPQDDINRASTMTILDKAIENYVKDNGASVTGTGDGVTLVVADNATVNGEIGSLLVAGDNSNVSVGSGSQLGDVNVTGNGSSVTIKDSGAGSVNVTGDNTKIILDGADAGSVSMTGDGTQLELGGDAKVGDLNVGGENTKLALGGKSEVDNVKISEGANGTTIDAGSGSTIGTVKNEAENTTVTGDGAVKNVESTTDVTVETKGTDVKNTGDADISVKGADGKESSVASGGSSSTAGTTTGTTTGGGSSSGGSSGGGSSGGGSESHSHTMVKTEAVAASCTTAGNNTYYTCSVCNKVYKDAAGTTETTVVAETISALGHTEVIDEAVEPTCTEAGKTEGKHCSVCNEVLVAQTDIPALGHSWGEGVVTTAPDYGVTGEMTFTCTVCGVVRTEDIAALEHHMKEVAGKEATCTEGGWTAYQICEDTDCDLIQNRELIPAAGHTEVVDQAVEPTCTETGKTEGRHCSVCNEVLVAQTVIPAAGHTEVTDEAVEPTCTETGKTEGKHCSVCNEVLVAQTIIPAAGHRFENGACRVCGYNAVAEYNRAKYASLQEAIDAASQKNGGQTEVTLLGDLTITETIVFAKRYGGSVLLNLGSYTLTGEGCRALQINKGNLYLENGTVTSTGIINSSSVIRIGSNEDAYSGVSPLLYMRNGAKVVAPDSYGVTIFGSKTVSEQLTVGGNASIVATGPSPAISGNGDKAYHVDGKGTKIIITGSAVVSAENNYAIYHPDNGTLNIQSSAAVSGKGGIQMCSGTLNISGSPKIEALGKADHETGAAGPIYDIAAISVVNRSYPGGAPVVTIKGTPTVIANEGEVIHAYTWSNNAESEWAEAGNNINVSGGTYSKTFNEAYLAADCTLVPNEGSYTVEQKKVAEYNGTQYTSLSQAILDANNSGAKATVKLLENVTLTNSLGIGGAAAVTLNLNKKTLTLDGAQIYTQGSATVTINNGTIKRTDEPASGSANNFAIQVMSGSSLILGGGTGSIYKVTLESTYGIYNVGGTLTVRYATITTDGWSIAVSDSASKTGVVYIGRGMGVNTKTVITSESGNVVGTMVNSKPDVTIDYGTLTSKGTAWDAGVVYWASEGTLTINGGTFTASSTEGSTAAAVYQKNGTVKITATSTTKLLGNNALVVKAGEGSTGTMVTELSGGTYSTKPDESWVVEGKEIHDTTDGMYKVENSYLVEVSIDGTATKYDSWFSAFTNATAQYKDATVKLLKDIETATLVSTYANVTIDFNGHTLKVSSTDEDAVAAITLLTGTPGTAKVTLKDSSEKKTGGMVTTGIYGVTVAGTNAALTVESGNYNCETTVVQVENGNSYIKGGTFKTDDTNKSYLLNCKDDAFAAGNAKMEVTGGTFHGFDPANNTAEGANTKFVAAGYVSTANGDGSYTVVAEVVNP